MNSGDLPKPTGEQDAQPSGTPPLGAAPDKESEHQTPFPANVERAMRADLEKALSKKIDEPGDCCDDDEGEDDEDSAGTSRLFDALTAWAGTNRMARRDSIKVNVHFIPRLVSAFLSAIKSLTGIVLFITCAVVLFNLIGPTPFPTGLSALFWILFVGTLAQLILAIIPWIQAARTKAFVARLVKKHGTKNVPNLLDYAHRKRKLLSGTAAYEALARFLAKENEVGHVFWIAGKKSGEVPSLPTEFEPRVLNERDSTFRDLWAATTGETKVLSTDLDPLRAMWRNIHLKGGGIRFFWLVLFLGVNLAGDLTTGNLSIPTVLFALWLFLMLTRPAEQGRLDDRWYAIPGGVFVDERAGHAMTRFRIISACDGNLSIVQQNRYKWRVFASDGDKKFGRAATRAEIDMLLAAWQTRVTDRSTKELVLAVDPEALEEKESGERNDEKGSGDWRVIDGKLHPPPSQPQWHCKSRREPNERSTKTKPS